METSFSLFDGAATDGAPGIVSADYFLICPELRGLLAEVYSSVHVFAASEWKPGEKREKPKSAGCSAA